MAARNFVAWTYTADDGTDYTRRADSRYTTQQGDNAPLVAVGGAAATGATLAREMPRNLEPRFVLGHETGTTYSAKLVVYTEAALAAITPGTTTFVSYDAGGTAHTCLVKEKHGEPSKRIING